MKVKTKMFDVLAKLRMQYDYSTRGERGWRKKAKKLTETKILKHFELNLNIDVSVVTQSNFTL